MLQQKNTMTWHQQYPAINNHRQITISDRNMENENDRQSEFEIDDPNSCSSLLEYIILYDINQ